MEQIIFLGHHKVSLGGGSRWKDEELMGRKQGFFVVEIAGIIESLFLI